MKKRSTPLAIPSRAAAAESRPHRVAAPADNKQLIAAISLHQQGQLDRAEAMYKEILQSHAQHFDALQLLATIEAQRKNSAAAVEMFDLALKINPNHAGTLNNRATALLHLGRYEEALESYDRALAVEPDHPEALNNRGNALLGLGRHQEALENFDRALNVKPDYPEALNNRGNALRELQRYHEALVSYDLALEIRPDFKEVYFNHGTTLNELRRYEEALKSFDLALKSEPRHVGALNNRGNALLGLGRYEDAVLSYDAALKIAPDHMQALYNRGTALFALGRHTEALQSFDAALKINANFVDALINRGNTLRALLRHDEALASFDLALKLRPDCAEALNNRGNALIDMGRHEEALESYGGALKIKPDFVEALNNSGNGLLNLGRYAEALECLNRALTIKPDYAEAANNRGAALLGLRRRHEALKSFVHALKIKPDYPEALNNSGNVLLDLGRQEEALEMFARALKIKPDHDFLYGMWLRTKMRICDWSGLDNQLAQLAERVGRDEKASTPFPILSMTDSRALQRKSAEIWVRTKYPESDALRPIARRPVRDKIRVGYFSADFHDHATTYLMAELFERHDKSQFELTAFSFGADKNDEMRNRVVAAFDRFLDVRHLPDKAVAMLARSLEIDIAVDLKGFTQESRTGIFSMRAAPLQVNYLGYPGTMGAEYIDYLIADSTLIPESHRNDYAEKIVYLPYSYQVNDTKRRIAGKAFSRRELGLADAGFVFCCFNNSYKITPATFASWMRILKQVDGSALWLFEDNPTAAENLRKEAELRGVSASRLYFAKRVPMPEHLARHRLADLFLDTLPYNAHTTASDAMWAGLPVLTCLGQTFAGRVAASLLNAIQLPELITATPDAYEALAIEIARVPGTLNSIRKKLEDHRLAAPLFNCQSITLDIEAAYRAMYERYHANLGPSHIFVRHVPPDIADGTVDLKSPVSRVTSFG